MKFSSKDFFSKRDQIRNFLRIWSHLLKKSLMENFIFCAVYRAFPLIGLYNNIEKTTFQISRGGSRTAATSKVELFAIIANGFQLLPIITKSSILDLAAVLDPPLISLFKFSYINLGTNRINEINHQKQYGNSINKNK